MVGSTEVVRFLRSSRLNRICIPDFVAMEILRPDGHASVAKSVMPLANFSGQVDVLVETAKVGARCVRSRGIQSRLIDREQTKSFPDYVALVKKACAGDKSIQHDFSIRRDKANEELNEIGHAWKDTVETYKDMQSYITRKEIGIIRKIGPIEAILSENIFKIVLKLAKNISDIYPESLPIPKYPDVSASFSFRLTLVRFLHFIEWVGTGSPSKIADKKLQNDSVDNAIIAIATYFDGFFSGDRRSIDRHNYAAQIIEAMHRSESARKHES